MQLREKTKQVKVKNVLIGGKKEIVLQSMTTCSAADISKTLAEIKLLQFHKCAIVRIAVLDKNDAIALKEIVNKSPLPIVADIHFVPALALDALENGVHKLRLNPGNINDTNLVSKIVLLAKKLHVPIRIGMNSGSITKKHLAQYGSIKKAMIGLCDQYINDFNKLGFDDIVLSFKASNVLLNIEVNELAASKYSYPLHLGVTESGGEKFGIIKSCAGLSPLLLKGIGNTLRISLTTKPHQEIIVAKQLLRSLELLKEGPDLVSCPTCGRMKNDIMPIVKVVENYLLKHQKNIHVSIMGCAVNGLGEAARSDIGVVIGNQNALYYQKGKFIKTIPYDQILKVILKDIDNFETK